MARSKKRFIAYTILLLILAAAVGYGIYDYFKPQAPSYMTVHSETEVRQLMFFY